MNGPERFQAAAAPTTSWDAAVCGERSWGARAIADAGESDDGRCAGVAGAGEAAG
jgi:hypothetical protein